MSPEILSLYQQLGVVMMGAQNAQLQTPASQARFAQDAQPGLITVSNSGIPSYLSNYLDPKVVEVLVAPMKAAEITRSEARKGDWLMDTATFIVAESTGETSAYGDYSTSGRANANANYPVRQSFHYQVMTEWGEREAERAGLAKLDWANRLNVASVLTLNKYQNKTYFFGVANLQNYGLLNDPSLSAAITPTTKTAGGAGWANATGDEVLADIAKLYAKLVSQSNGTIDRDTPMTLATSPVSDANGFTKVTQYNVSVADRVKKLYPNLEVETAPEYSTASGELVQMIVRELDGQETATCAFTEKLRAHPMVVDVSSFKQKKSQGTWGTVIFRPFLIAQMLGV